MTTEWDVIVVGGGLAGLTAGATARAAGASVVVLEGHRPGGRARVTERGGFRFNHGAHALYVGGPGAGVLRALGVRPEGTPPPLASYRAMYEGRLHLLPTGPRSLLTTTLVGRRSKLQLARFLAAVPRMRPATLAGTSVGEWLASRELRPDAEATVRALLRIGTYADDLDAMGADAALGQLQAGVRSGVVYVHGGWAQLVDALGALVEVRADQAVRAIEPAAGGAEVRTDGARLVARRVIVAAGTPAACAALLPTGAGWEDPGPPVTAACLDLGTSRVPEPGYVLGIDEPIYATTQSPPGRQSPAGTAVVSAVRYGARNADLDRRDLAAHIARAGVSRTDIVEERFLARMTVAGALPRAAAGGLVGRPGVGASGVPHVLLAGDWVGAEGLLADAALASGRAAALAAVAQIERQPVAA